MKAYTLVHTYESNDPVKQEDGSWDTVAPLDQEGDGILFYDLEQAEQSAERHNDPDEYDTPCVVVGIEIKAG